MTEKENPEVVETTEDGKKTFTEEIEVGVMVTSQAASRGLVGNLLERQRVLFSNLLNSWKNLLENLSSPEVHRS